MNNIQEIINNNQCCGCGACINICPKSALGFAEDKYAFILPEINNKLCIDCGRCFQVCPFTASCENSPIEVYAAMNKDEDVRFASSSGGVFGLLARCVISSFCGVVYGSTMDEKFQVYHSSADNERDLKKLLKSKYVQSFMGDCYSKVISDLRVGKTVLYVGTPCQVTAMKKFIPNSMRERLYLIDIVCHGVPSQKFFDSYLQCLTKKEGDLVSYQFRAKKRINNGMNWFFSYQTRGGRKRIKNWPEDTFNYLYMMSYIYRDSCYGCKFAKEERAGDITLADYWGFPKYQKEFPVGSTVSAVLLNTIKGRALFNAVRNDLYLAPANIENVKRHNGCLVNPQQKPNERNKVLEFWLENGFEKLDYEYKTRNEKAILKCILMRHIPQEMMNRLANIITRIKK